MPFCLQLWENKVTYYKSTHCRQSIEILCLSTEVRTVLLQGVSLFEVIEFIKFNVGYYCSCLNNFPSKNLTGLLLQLPDFHVFHSTYIFAFVQF